MLNALKNSFPDDHDSDETEAVGGKSFFKTKWPLLILLLLGLFVGVFSLFSDQKKNIVAKKILPQPQIVPPLAGRKTTSNSPPSVDKPNPLPIAKPLVKNNITEFAYKGDKEYLALTRYEGFSQATKKPVRASRQKVRNTLTPGDKPLILGGRGFDFKGSQPQTRTRRYADFTRRLQKPLPKKAPVPEDHLDLRLTQAKSSKELIFHPLSPALGKYDRQRIYLKGEKTEKRKLQVLEDIPETKLLLMETDNSVLILRNRRESLDLLAGNEKINRNEFKRW